MPQQYVNGPRIVEVGATQEIYNRELPDSNAGEGGLYPGLKKR
jgi:hypothetical protein